MVPVLVSRRIRCKCYSSLCVTHSLQVSRAMAMDAQMLAAYINASYFASCFTQSAGKVTRRQQLRHMRQFGLTVM